VAGKLKPEVPSLPNPASPEVKQAASQAVDAVKVGTCTELPQCTCSKEVQLSWSRHRALRHICRVRRQRRWRRRHPLHPMPSCWAWQLLGWWGQVIAVLLGCIVTSQSMLCVLLEHPFYTQLLWSISA
jgi:hypothetical protein